MFVNIGRLQPWYRDGYAGVRWQYSGILGSNTSWIQQACRVRVDKLGPPGLAQHESAAITNGAYKAVEACKGMLAVLDGVRSRQRGWYCQCVTTGQGICRLKPLTM